MNKACEPLKRRLEARLIVDMIRRVMRVTILHVFVLALTGASAAAEDHGLIVYGTVPGAEASGQYVLAATHHSPPAMAYISPEHALSTFLSPGYGLP